MKKKAGKAKAGRRRMATRDLAAKKGGAKGGVLIGLLLPAVQKVREAPSGGVNVALGDGSVRFLKDSVSQ